MTSETTTRIISLWRLALRLRRVTESSDWRPPTGAEARSINHELDSISDEIERVIWRLDDLRAKS
jgi:hypothetical protein